MIVSVSVDPVSRRITLPKYESFTFIFFIHHCFFLFHLNFLKMAKFIGLKTIPVVLVSLSYFTSDRNGLNSRHVISISSISCGVISLTLHVLHVSIHMTLNFRGWLSLGTVWCNVPFFSTIVSRCILLRKSSCSALFIFSIIVRLFVGKLLSLLFL